MYRFETHCHTRESSACGTVPAREIVEQYRKAGYDGIVVTDHFNNFNLNVKHAGMTNEEKARSLYAGYHAAKASAGTSMVVLPGMEIRFLENENDYLVYGADEALYIRHPDILSWGLKKFRRYADDHGYIVVQAHPFRNGMTVMNPGLLHWIEVHNGHPRHDSRNDIAAAWAALFGLNGLSGSDFHEPGDAGHGGVLLAEKPVNMASFMDMLRQGVTLIR